MTKFNEDKALANLYLNLKGGKQKKDDWITIATELKRLTDFYKSPTKTAAKLGVSYELVRSILTILNLPKEVQSLIKQGRILYDAAQRLTRIDDDKRKIEVANAISGVSSHKARDIIQFAKSNPNASLDGFKKRITAPKSPKETIHLAVLPIRKEMYSLLQERSRHDGISTQKLILRIIDEWSQRKS